MAAMSATYFEVGSSSFLRLWKNLRNINLGQQGEAVLVAVQPLVLSHDLTRGLE